MRFLVILFCVFLSLKADFLGSIYMELKGLNLSLEQQNKLSNIIKSHHLFLRQWYVDFKENNEEILKNFSSSSLSLDSISLKNSIRLESERIKAEESFLLSVYEILSKEQRLNLSKKIRDKEYGNKILQNKLYSQEFRKSK